MIRQTDTSLCIGNDVLHQHKQPAKHFIHPPCVDNERMGLQLDPQEGFSPKGLTCRGSNKQFFAQCLECERFLSEASPHEINDAETTSAQQIENLIFAADYVALFERFGK